MDPEGSSPTERANGAWMVVDSSSFFPSTQPGRVRAGLAASQTAQLATAGCPARSRPVYQRPQATHVVHIRPRNWKPAAPPAALSNPARVMETRESPTSGLRLRACSSARPCGNQAGPRGRGRSSGADAASRLTHAGAPRRGLRPLLPVFSAHANALPSAVRRSNRPRDRPDPTHGRGVVGLAPLRCRAEPVRPTTN